MDKFIVIVENCQKCIGQVKKKELGIIELVLVSLGHVLLNLPLLLTLPWW